MRKAFLEALRKYPISFIILNVLLWPLVLFTRIKHKINTKVASTSGFTNSDTSFYRRWVAQQESTFAKLAVPDDSTLLVGLVMCIGKFNLAQKESITSESIALGKFGDDFTLFELGCYLLSVIDVWIYNHYPSRHKDFMKNALNEFITISSLALDMPDLEVSKLLSMRFNTYRMMYRNERPITEYIEYLTELSLYTLEQHKLFRGSDMPINISLEKIIVSLSIQLWVSSFVPASCEMLENYFKHYKTKNASK